VVRIEDSQILWLPTLYYLPRHWSFSRRVASFNTAEWLVVNGIAPDILYIDLISPPIGIDYNAEFGQAP
jgi:hypothetical protein